MDVTSLLVVCLTVVVSVWAQDDDFSSPIKCFSCSGSVEDSACSDPQTKPMNLTHRVCESGVCLKYTLYEGYKLQIKRGCSSELDFYLTMIDGVCRTERNGNGYLCMCGKNLCNAAPPRLALRGGSYGWMVLSAVVVLAMVVNSCFTAGGSGGGAIAGVYWSTGLGNVFPVR